MEKEQCQSILYFFPSTQIIEGFAFSEGWSWLGPRDGGEEGATITNLCARVRC